MRANNSASKYFVNSHFILKLFPKVCQVQTILFGHESIAPQTGLLARGEPRFGSLTEIRGIMADIDREAGTAGDFTLSLTTNNASARRHGNEMRQDSLFPFLAIFYYIQLSFGFISKFLFQIFREIFLPMLSDEYPYAWVSVIFFIGFLHCFVLAKL